eukprot:758848-Hanusia_phi.AAC.2
MSARNLLPPTVPRAPTRDGLSHQSHTTSWLPVVLPGALSRHVPSVDTLEIQRPPSILPFLAAQVRCEGQRWQEFHGKTLRLRLAA